MSSEFSHQNHGLNPCTKPCQCCGKPVLAAWAVGAFQGSSQLETKQNIVYVWIIMQTSFLTASTLHMNNLSPPWIIFLALCTTSPAFQEHFKQTHITSVCNIVLMCHWEILRAKCIQSVFPCSELQEPCQLCPELYLHTVLWHEDKFH